MAMQRLEAELDALIKYMWPPGKTSGADNPIRKLMNREKHVFTLNTSIIVKQLQEHAERDISRPDNMKRKKTQGAKKSAEIDAWEAQHPEVQKFNRTGDKAILTKFAKALIAAYLVKLKGEGDAAAIVGSHTVDELTFALFKKEEGLPGYPNPFNKLKEFRTQLGNQVINSSKAYKDLFGGEGRSRHVKENEKTGEYSGAQNLLDIGHQDPVIEAKAAMTLSKLSEYEDTFLKIDELEKSPINPMKHFVDTLANLDVHMEHYRNIKAGPPPSFEDVREIHTNLEGAFVNQVLKANREYEGAISERVLKDAIEEVTNDTRAMINEYYLKAIDKGLADESSSMSIMESISNLLVSRMIKRKLHSSANFSYKEPKSIGRRPTRTRTRTYKTRTVDHGNINAVGGSEKGGKSPMRGGERTSGMNRQVANLPALINAQLGRTILKNMGPPALESRTGTFAAGAKVMSAVDAAGVTRLDYTYQKNPYEVFEMGGRGRAPWATEGRDPRTLIDKSIREIAAEMALGAFTTRRV